MRAKPLYFCAAIMALATGAEAQFTQDEMNAYRQGRIDGWNECLRHPNCGMTVPPYLITEPGTVGTVATGTAPGTTGLPGTQGYVVPQELIAGFDPDDGVAYKIPQDWLVTPSPGGAGVLGKADAGGQFQPYVTGPTGQVGLGTDSQLPVWTTDDSFRQLIKDLPKAGDGMVFVPIEPANEF